MARDGREVWAKRVERWRESGLTAKEYAAEVGLNPNTLTHWGSRLEGFTADHLAAFCRHGTEPVLIVYDRDEAGDRAAVKLSDKLSAEGIGTYRSSFRAAWTRTSTHSR